MLTALLAILTTSLHPEEPDGPTWTVLEPIQMLSRAGATLETLPDGSVFVSGENATRDVYELEFFTDLTPITGLRLEAIPDDRLPKNGSGRATNGNFVVSLLEVEARSKHGRRFLPVQLESPTADFSQDTKHVAGICDGMLNTGWSIYPKMGKRHTVVLEIARDLAHKTGTALRVRLHFEYGSQHTLGRFRLSATSAPKPLRAPGSPEQSAWHETQDRVPIAIDRGIQFLLDQQELDGSWSFKQDSYRTGQTALSIYALLKSGLPADHPSVRRGIEFLRINDSFKTYSIACHIIALCTYQDPRDAERIQLMVDELISWQNRGGFAYPTGSLDLSNTQYAALALRTAANAGFGVPQPVWNRLADYALLNKEENRNPYAAAGFSYRGNAAPSLSMTAAGVGVLAIVDEQMRRKRGDVKVGIEHGLRWIDEHWDVHNNVRPGEGHQNRYLQYWLYGLERVGGLLGIAKIGDHDWYREGARALVESQKKDGSWTAPAYDEKQPNTCFGLLFLSRATGTTTGAAGTTRVKSYGGVDPRADVSLCATGDSPLAIWIAGFGDLACVSDTHAGETTPRVAKVEYWYAGDREQDEPLAMAAVDGDPRRPAGDDRFAAQFVFPRTGTFVVWATVHVAGPDGPVILESAPLEVRITAAPDAMLARYAEDGARNVLTRTRILARASSELHDQHTANLAVDNLQSRGWLSADNDPSPSIVLDLERQVKADTLLLSHTVTTDEKRTARIVRVRLEVNRTEQFDIVMDQDDRRKTIFRLPKPVQVRRLALIVLEATPDAGEKQGVGFAEIELQLSGE